MNDFFKTIKSFLTEYLPNQRCYSTETIRSYKQCLNLLMKYLRDVRNFKVSEIDFTIFNRELILAFLDWLESERKVSTSTRNQRLMALRSFFKYAGIVDCSQISTGFEISAVYMKKCQNKIVPFLSGNALKVLLEQPDINRRNGHRDQFFMIFMYDTAARCSEVVNLKICDLKVNVKHPVAHLTGKGNKKRIVPLLDKTVEHYRKYLQKFHPNEKSDSDQFLFYSIIHGVHHPLTISAIEKFVGKYGKAAHLKCAEVPEKIHPHMIRHSRSMHLYRNGMPMMLLSEYLGHSSPESTKVYAFADTEMKRQAIQRADVLRQGVEPPPAIWENDEEMILKLSGLV